MYIKHCPNCSIPGLVITVLTIIMLVQTASAVSLGVSPHSLQFNPENGLIQRNITVINNGNEVSGYEVYADSVYSGWTTISPSSFVLSPGMTREVSIRCIPSKNAAGNITFKLNVIAKSESADADLGIGAGIRLPVTVIAGESKDEPDAQFLESFSRYIRIISESTEQVETLIPKGSSRYS